MFGRSKSTNNKNTEQPQSSVTRVSKKKTKRRGKHKSFKRQFPSIAALKIPAVVPSAVVDELQKIVTDASDGGAVRQTTEGYTVVVLDEQSLEAVGLTSRAKTSDFGQLAASLHKMTISSASLSGDLALGHLVIIPTGDTLSSLDEFDQLREAEFHWGIFPTNVDDDDLESTIHVLDSTVSLSQLADMGDRGLQVSVTGDTLTIVEPQTAPASSSAPETSEAPTVPPVDSASTSAPDPSTSSAGSSLFANDDAADDTTTEAPISAAAPAPKAAPAKGASSAPAEPATKVSEPTTPAKGQTGVNWDALLGGDQKPVVANDTADTPADKNKATDASQDMAHVSSARLYDPDLHLTVDLSVFDTMFPKSSAPVLSLDNVPIDDRSDQLKQVALEFVKSGNARLRDLHETHQYTLKQSFVGQSQEFIAMIAQRLSISDATGSIGKERQKIEDTYRKRQGNKSSEVQVATKQFRDDYANRRNEFGEQAKLAAVSSFDELHHDGFQQQIQLAENRVDMEISTQRSAALQTLNDQRQSIAGVSFNDVSSQLTSSLQKIARNMQTDEDKLQQSLQQELTDIVSKAYHQDVLRQQAVADADRHDSRLKDLQDKDAELQSSVIKQLKDASDENDRLLAEKTRQHDQETEALKKRFQSELATSNDALSEERLRTQTLQNKVEQIVAEKTQLILAKDKDTKEQLATEQAKHEAELSKLDKANQRAHRTLLTMSIVGVIAAIAVGILIGALFFGRMSGSTAQRSTTSPFNVTIKNPSNNATPAASSSSTDSSSSTASSSSSNDRKSSNSQQTNKDSSSQTTKSSNSSHK